MRPAERTRLVMGVIGWQGGTVHDLCRTLGLDVQEFLHADVQGVGPIDGPFAGGWFAARTCSTEHVKNVCIPAHRGDLQFWFGAAAGRNLDEQDQAAEYERRVEAYETEGMTRSDAQGRVDAEDMRITEAK